MEYDDETLEKARGIAQLILDSGVGFVEHPRNKGTGYLGVNRKRRNARPIGVYTYEEARELGLKPSSELQDAMRSMMLARHEEYQRERKAEDRAKAKFFSSKAWLTLRYQVLSERGARCECCGADAKDGAKIQVDHIKPRSKYPELELVKSNLQVLCRACNLGKSNRYTDDWRKDKPKRILRKAA